MSVIRFLRNCALTLTVSVVAIDPLIAQSGSHGTLQVKLERLDVQSQHLNHELEFTTSKRQSTEAKLKQSQRELKDREADLQRLRIELGESPSPLKTETLANEQQRVALAELNIKSLQAAVVRLERKEEELQAALADIATEKQTTTKAIANAQQRARAQANARAKAVETELEALKRENERLRLAMEEEARRAEEAAAEARLLAELAAKQQQERLEQEALEEQKRQAMAAAPGGEPAQKSVPQRPGTQDVQADEPPIHVGDDGMRVVIRSRSIEAPVVMKPIGPDLYQAEVVVEPGKAYFDVRNQRFRGHFPESEEPQAFVFLYDTSGENPSFLLKGRSGESEQRDSQIVTDSHSPF